MTALDLTSDCNMPGDILPVTDNLDYKPSLRDSIPSIGISLIIVIAAFMVRIPGPLGSLPNINIAGVIIGPTNLYTFSLLIVSLSVLAVRSSYDLPTIVIVPKSAIYIFLLCISIIASAFYNSVYTPSTVIEIVQWAGILGLVFLTSNYLRSLSDFRKLFRIMTLVAFIKAIYVLCSLAIFGIPQSTYGSVIMGMGLLIVLSPALSSISLRHRLLGSGILIPPIALSGSRKVIVSIIFSIVIVTIWGELIKDQKPSSSGIWPIICFLVPISLTIIAIITNLRHGIFNLIKPILHSISEPRFHLYQTAFEIISDHPLFGVGVDNWYAVKPDYSTPGLRELENAEGRNWGVHSYYLKIFSDLGLVGFIPFLLLVTIPIRQAHYYICKFKKDEELWIAIAYLSFYFMIIATVSAVSKPIQAAWFLVIGMSSALANFQNQ